MSRWIDAEKELKKLKDMKVEGEVFTTAVNFAIKVIEEAPTIDLVRCAECKHWSRMPYCCCEFFDRDTAADDFCSYGERRASDDIG